MQHYNYQGLNSSAKNLLSLQPYGGFGCKTSEYLNTDTGAPEGHCANANEFTYYLPKSLASIFTFTPRDHSYAQQDICILSIPDEFTEHNYANQSHQSRQEYVDDASEFRKFKYEGPKVLLSGGLQENNTKTEEYLINKEQNNQKKNANYSVSYQSPQKIQKKKKIGNNSSKQHKIYLQKQKNHTKIQITSI